MNKTTSIFGVTTNGGIVTNISKSAIYQPKTNFGGGTIKWFDDSQLIRKPESGDCNG